METAPRLRDTPDRSGRLASDVYKGFNRGLFYKGFSLCKMLNQGWNERKRLSTAMADTTHRLEPDHWGIKGRYRPMRGFKGPDQPRDPELALPQLRRYWLARALTEP